MSIAMPLVVLVLFAMAPAWNRGPTLSRWGRYASPGPLTRSHAVWESRCDACHLPFTSVGRSQVSDRKCQACHDGPPHHAAQLASGVPPCGSCHSDHHGRETTLVRMDDSFCTQCHRALTKYRKANAGPLKFAASVTHFDGNPDHHSEVRWLRGGNGDPGRVAFNHKLHVARGVTLEPQGKPFTYAQLPEAERVRYGWKPGSQARRRHSARVRLVSPARQRGVPRGLGPDGVLADPQLRGIYASGLVREPLPRLPHAPLRSQAPRV